jgi:hypothetical protein
MIMTPAGVQHVTGPRLCGFIMLAAMLASALSSGQVHGRELFVSTFMVGDALERRGVGSLKDFAELFDDESLSQLFEGYTPGSSVLAAVELRGVPAVISYDADSTTLDLVIPRVLNVSFTGATREDAQEQLEDFLRGEIEISGISLQPLLQELVEKSPVDPVAGNPNSLQTRMFVNDFELATRPWIVAGDDWRTSENFFTFDLGGGYAEGSIADADFDVGFVDLRGGYQLNFGDGRFGINFDLPVTLTNTEGGESYFASFGLGFQYRPTPWWTIQPAARIGAAGSIDLGALAAIYSGTITNYLTYAFDNGIGIGWGIEAGVANTIEGIEIDDIDLEYNLTNTILRNGFNASGPLGFSAFGQAFGWRAFFTDTHFFGDELFLEHYNELGAAINLLSSEEGPAYDWLSVGATYQFGDDYDGFRLGASFRF